MNRVIRFIKEEDGQSVAELCVLLPFILLLIFSVLTVGLLVYSKLLVTFAAGQAVDRAAEVMGDDTMTYAEKEYEVEEVAYGYLSNGISGDERDLDIQVVDDKIEVTVEYEFRYFFQFTDEIFGEKQSMTISSTAIDFVE